MKKRNAWIIVHSGNLLSAYSSRLKVYRLLKKGKAEIWHEYKFVPLNSYPAFCVRLSFGDIRFKITNETGEENIDQFLNVLIFIKHITIK